MREGFSITLDDITLEEYNAFSLITHEQERWEAEERRRQEDANRKS